MKLTDEQREEKPMENFARAYELERINRVLDSLDKGVFKSLSAYADAEYFLRFAQSEINRLKASEQALRDQLAEEKAAHNLHMTELIEMEKRLREAVEVLNDLLDDYTDRANPIDSELVKRTYALLSSLGGKYENT